MSAVMKRIRSLEKQLRALKKATSSNEAGVASPRKGSAPAACRGVLQCNSCLFYLNLLFMLVDDVCAPSVRWMLLLLLRGAANVTPLSKLHHVSDLVATQVFNLYLAGGQSLDELLSLKPPARRLCCECGTRVYNKFKDECFFYEAQLRLKAKRPLASRSEATIRSELGPSITTIAAEIGGVNMFPDRGITFSARFADGEVYIAECDMAIGAGGMCAYTDMKQDGGGGICPSDSLNLITSHNVCRAPSSQSALQSRSHS